MHNWLENRVMGTQAREWLVLVEHRGPTPLAGACFEYTIVAPSESTAETRARDKHNYRETPYNIVASVETPLPTNVQSMDDADLYESKRRIG